MATDGLMTIDLTNICTFWRQPFGARTLLTAAVCILRRQERLTETARQGYTAGEMEKGAER